MLTVTSNLLPTQPDTTQYRGTIAQVVLTGEPYLATIANLEYSNATAIALANPTPGGAIALPADVDTVAAVVANGQVLQMALDPEDPQDGEYIFNPYTKTIQVYGDFKSVVAYTLAEDIPFAPSFVSGMPSLFYQLPIIGEIQISGSLEQHPSAQFAFTTHYHKSTIESIFKPGTELNLFNIPFRVSSVNISEQPRSLYPDGVNSVSVSLSGKWENYINTPCFLRRDGSNILDDTTPFQDPECTDPEQYAKDPNSSVDISTLLGRAGIPYRGEKLKRVPIPSNTPRDAIVTPASLLDERLKIANSFVRWSNVNGCETVRINGLTTHTILERDILGEVSTGYSGIFKQSKQALAAQSLMPAEFDLTNFPSAIASPSPQLVSETPTNLTFEYANVELRGGFEDTLTEKDEFTATQTPRYVRKETKRTERIEGDKEAHLPLYGTDRLKTMSLCFDLGGQTRSRTYITEEDGAIVRTVQETWGFAYTAEEIWQPAIVINPESENPEVQRFPGLDGIALDYWRLLKRITTDYYYDDKTGYLLYKIGNGFNTVRYLQENATKPETLKFYGSGNASDGSGASSIISIFRTLYQFFTIPIIERHYRKLRLMPDYSTDGLFELVKVCNRDGTSSYQQLVNPDYAPPYYIEEEVTESTGFATRFNPKNIGKDIAPNVIFEPDLVVGSESYYSAKIEVTPAEYEEQIVGFDGQYPIVERGELITPQKWYKTLVKYSAEGEAIASAREEVSVEEGTGNPPEAERRPPRYKLEQPEKKEPRTETKQEHKYLIWTAGYSPESPITGSESFDLAETLAEALTAAKCKLALENWRNGYSENLETLFRPQIKEGDRILYFCNGQLRDRVVLSVNHTLNILGAVDGVPKVTGTTKLTLGKYRLPELQYSKVKIPATNDGKNFDIGIVNVINETLDGGIVWSDIVSRRRF